MTCTVSKVVFDSKRAKEVGNGQFRLFCLHGRIIELTCLHIRTNSEVAMGSQVYDLERFEFCFFWAAMKTRHSD